MTDLCTELFTVARELADASTDAVTPSDHDAFLYAANLVSIQAIGALHPDAHGLSGASLIPILDGVVRQVHHVLTRTTAFDYADSVRRVLDLLQRRYTAGDDYRVTFRDSAGQRHAVVVRATTSIAAETYARDRFSNRVIGDPLPAVGEVRVVSVTGLSLSPRPRP